MSLTRKRHNTVCDRGPEPGQQFQVTRVTLQTPELGTWDVFEWVLLNRNGILDRGSYAAATDSNGLFHTERDVFDHLAYVFVRQHEYDYAGAPDGPSDADPGL